MNSSQSSLTRWRRAVIVIITLAAGTLLLVWIAAPARPMERIQSLWATPSLTPTLTATPSATPTPTSTPTETPRPTRTPHPRIEVVPGQLVYVQHESTSRGKGLPDTYQYHDFNFARALPGSALREYIRGVQRLAVPNMSEQEFEKNMASFWAGNRALSNGHGYEEDFAVGPVITGGAMARATGSVRYRGGKALVEIVALDPNNLPPVPASLYDVDWTLHFRPTIVTRFLRPDGRWRVNPFPQFDGWGIAPILGEGGRQWISADILVPINAPVSPFEYPELEAWPTASPP